MWRKKRPGRPRQNGPRSACGEITKAHKKRQQKEAHEKRLAQVAKIRKRESNLGGELDRDAFTQPSMSEPIGVYFNAGKLQASPDEDPRLASDRYRAAGIYQSLAGKARRSLQAPSRHAKGMSWEVGQNFSLPDPEQDRLDAAALEKLVEIRRTLGAYTGVLNAVLLDLRQVSDLDGLRRGLDIVAAMTGAPLQHPDGSKKKPIAA